MRNITAQQLKEWMDRGEAVVVDVREPAEYEAAHIPGAVSLPLGYIGQKALPEHAGRHLVFQCRSGRRGGTACDRLAEIDRSLDTYNLDGGIAAWSLAGYNVNASGKFFLPLDRQVQLAIGLSVLAGSLLGFFASPWFFLLTGFFGLGLTFAGLTGFCGLALLMAKMPWNAKGA